MSTGKALWGVLAGLAAGTVLGVLLAPNKGDRMRKDISKRGKDLAEALDQKIDIKFDDLVNALIKANKVQPKRDVDKANKSQEVG
jgi:gas vesicle protein